MYGAWHFIHGHSGTLEDTHSISALERKGWGMSFWQRSQTTNWVHFAIPSNALYGWRVDHLHLKFAMGEHAKISELHLWDGNVQIWQQIVDYPGGASDIMLPLGNEYEVTRALGLSIKVEANALGDGHVMFHAVGANFRQI